MLQVAGVGELDLADAGDGIGEQRRPGGVPAIAVEPCRSVARRGGRGRRGIALGGERGDAGGIQRGVVDAQFVKVRAAHEIVAALYLMRGDDAAGKAELVQPGIEIGGGFGTRDLATLHIQADAPGLVPGEGEMLPCGGIGAPGDGPGHADARQIGVRDEGVETVAVPVDAQERHVPAAVIGIAGAEDHERRLAQRLARAPEEGQRAARGGDVAGRAPGDIAVVLPARGAADRAVADDADPAAEIGNGIAGRLLRRQALVGGKAEGERLGGGGGGQGRAQGEKGTGGARQRIASPPDQACTRARRGLSR